METKIRFDRTGKLAFTRKDGRPVVTPIWFDVDDGPGLPSRWVTMRAMRVLDWAGVE